MPDLAPLLWHSFGTIAALLQEIIAVYPMINPPSLTVSELQTMECVIIIKCTYYVRLTSPIEFAMRWLCCNVLHHTQRRDQHFWQVGL